MSSKHIVQQGEYLSTIAARYGFRDWRFIYDHPDNAEFRKRRPNPNILFPGDEITVPDRRLKAFACETGKAHRFVAKKPPPDELIVVLHSQRRQPLANELCEIEFAVPTGSSPDQATIRKRTSENGELRVPIPEGASDAVITALDHSEYAWTIAIGRLDPVRDKHVPFDSERCIVTGIQARLNNLGFYCGKVDGILGRRTRAALRAFQSWALGREEPDGVLDQETCHKLEEEHEI